MIQLAMALGGIELDVTAPFPFKTADEVQHAIELYLAANYDPANTEVFFGLSKKGWLRRAMNSVAGLSFFYQFILNNSGVYLAWYSNKIGCPLELSVTTSVDSLVYFNGKEHLILVDQPKNPGEQKPITVCAGKECFDFTIGQVTL
jgi:hypothetical protein